jgi:hypothetical protein
MPIIGSFGAGSVGGFGQGRGGFGAPVSMDFLVIAGGGNGGSKGGTAAGGAGAGGYRNSYASENSGRNSPTEANIEPRTGEVLTITVGAGGATSYPTQTSDDGGQDSSIVGQTGVNITSLGGGRGYGTLYLAPNADTQATNGGSGGGAYSPPSSNGAGAGTAGQGFDGGNQPRSNPLYYSNAGGGGAGGPVSVGSFPSPGGAGLASSITGSSVTRGGGGGGGKYKAPSDPTNGGSGGGGNGGHGNPPQGITQATSGSTNTGSGGGGSGGGDPGPFDTARWQGGQGGSGIVILRLPTADYSGETTGTPTVTTDGSDTILQFTGSGTYKV